MIRDMSHKNPLYDIVNAIELETISAIHDILMKARADQDLGPS